MDDPKPSMADVTAHGLLPVIVLDDAAHAGPLAEALVKGGLPVAEVTLRTPSALASIAAMAASGDLLVGAGTVRTPEDVDRAVDAGARFVVSPGLRADVVRRAQHHGLPILPGCVTASDLMTAEALGLSTVKFFPAAQFGGAATIAALSAPFPDIEFVPTGGIAAADLGAYLRLPAVPAVGGSWMVAGAGAGDFEQVAARCADAVAAVRALRTIHPNS